MNHLDYHIHSHYSDGSDSPTEIVQRSKKLGITHIAITDHDTIGGLEEANYVAKAVNIQFLKGIELSVRYEKTRLIHILGLGLETEQTTFQVQYQKYRDCREKSLVKVIKALEEKQIFINLEDLRTISFDEKLDRQAVAKWLIANQYAPDMQKAWNNYLDPIPYAEEELLTPEAAFEMIHAANGKAFLAHIHKPIGMYGYSKEETMARVSALKAMGLDGIESRYPSYLNSDLEQVEDLVRTLGLEQSGGSDYHGVYRPDVELGD